MKLFILMVTLVLPLVACDSRTATQIGKDLAQQKVDIIKGAGEIIKNEGEGVANTVAQGVGNVISGLQSGFDESLIKTEVRLSDLIKPKALIVSRAHRIARSRQDEREGLSVYLSSDEGFSGDLRLIAHSKEGEVGRSKSSAKIDKQSAKYIDFEFDKRTPFRVVLYYTLEAIN